MPMQEHLEKDIGDGRQKDNFDFEQDRFDSNVKCLCLAKLPSKVIPSSDVQIKHAEPKQQFVHLQLIQEIHCQQY